MMSDEGATPSSYGVYRVSDSIEFSLPNVIIKIERIGNNAFSYYRRDSEGKIVEKMIPVKSDEIRVELAPIHPLNHPARRTEHVFLRFDREIHLSEDSTASIHVNCPIEVGVFLINGARKEPLDWATCNPLNSRFGLYGPPDTGTLCKYAKVGPAADMSDSIPFVDGTMKIIIENTLDAGQTVGSVIFPITDNSLYYRDSKAVMDGIRITLRKRAVVSVADVQTEPLDTEWTRSPVWEDAAAEAPTEDGPE